MQYNVNNHINRTAIRYINQIESDGLKLKIALVLVNNLTDKLCNVLILISIRNYIWQILICNQDRVNQLRNHRKPFTNQIVIY